VKKTFGHIESWRFKLPSGDRLLVKRRNIDYQGTVTVVWDAELITGNEIVSGSGLTRREAINDLRAELKKVLP
jgi:hypothetical protein